MHKLFQYSLTGLLCFSLVSCSDNKNSLTGYIEGEYTYIASGIAGTLEKINVVRGQEVQKDLLLYSLDQEPEHAFMQATAENVAELEPQLAYAKKQLERQRDLVAHNAASQEAKDLAQRDFDSLTRQLQSAKNTLAQAEWSLQQKTIYAPIAGYVYDTFFRVGEKVAANQPVLAILSPANINVLFYIPETQLSTIHIGQTIHFRCDQCVQKNTAKISYISSDAEYTPPIIYSRDTRYKLVYLVRAKMPKDIAKQFHPGQPLDIFLNE